MTDLPLCEMRVNILCDEMLLDAHLTCKNSLLRNTMDKEGRDYTLRNHSRRVGSIRFL